ncbi:GLPGLI family protein [Flavobacterium lacisediminis]|uniref:GLPGLI family protein n=1 Tax=Flavobacterium lacisediminis TaxID=2989705 RepID=A0ABT3EHT3_9FLAO|nr:GLPGLI family protein [Flavobacterium lacisediminis]MCW1148136.1 GLPGLI family protein [Flavobacterium lacisediminis]
MKKIIIASIFMISGLLNAQNFQGMAVYESKTSTADFMKGMSGNRDMTPEMQKQIEERMKKMFERTFVLNFDKTASIYKEEEKLDAPGGQQQGGRMMMSMMGGGGTHYKNAKDKQYVVDKEFFGKEFLIKDSLPKYEWKLEGESKQIGNYTCFKATAVVKVSESDFRNFRFRNNNKAKEEEKKAETVKDTTKAKKTNFTDDWEMPKENVITAWYCPEIPVNQGPENYWGLPGLILEVNDGKTVILCSKLVLNSKEKVEIKPVSKGKEVTQKEFDEIVKKKMEEMREMNSGRGGQGGGFRMGGAR